MQVTVANNRCDPNHGASRCFLIFSSCPGCFYPLEANLVFYFQGTGPQTFRDESFFASSAGARGGKWRRNRKGQPKHPSPVLRYADPSGEESSGSNDHKAPIQLSRKAWKMVGNVSKPLQAHKASINHNTKQLHNLIAPRNPHITPFKLSKTHLKLLENSINLYKTTNTTRILCLPKTRSLQAPHHFLSATPWAANCGHGFYAAAAGTRAATWR